MAALALLLKNGNNVLVESRAGRARAGHQRRGATDQAGDDYEARQLFMLLNLMG
jgi:hypothetical protein